MRRRELLQVFGGALAWPLAARAEQPAAVIGLVYAALASYFAQLAPSVSYGSWVPARSHTERSSAVN